MRLLSTVLSAVAIGLLASGPARADQCKPINATITTSVTGCLAGESPIGFCTAGNIDSGLLAGTTRFGVQTMTVNPDGSISYIGVLTITTKSGTVTINDYGILVPVTNEMAMYTEMQQVVSGTGRFKHMTGTIVSQGTETITIATLTFSGTLVGALCHFNEGHHGE